MWCKRCGLNVSKEFVEDGCSYWLCPVKNVPVNVDDEMHTILAEALKGKDDGRA